MKKYFAKLLPVGEEKTEKLFLCSGAIPVIGNKVFLENSYNYFSEVIDKVGGSDRDIVLKEMPEQRKNGTLDYREMIIPVGEISPNAIWVKEGDEFGEDEWSIFLEYKEADEYGLCNPRDLTPDEIMFKIEYGYKQEPFVRLKCSMCKNFH